MSQVKSHRLWTAHREVFDPGARGEGDLKLKQFVEEDVQDDCVEC